MASGFRNIARSRLFRTFLYHFIRLYSMTFRLKIENEEGWKEYHRTGGRVILCAWHQQFFSAIRHFQAYRDYRPALMISQSNDGDIIADVAERSGWCAVRGSSSRGGKKALKRMIEHLKEYGLAAHIVDGPRGPAGVIKPGIIQLARGADAVIVPFYTSADRAWYFKSWDRFFLPKPFSIVTIRFEDVVGSAGSQDPSLFEEQLRNLETVMSPHLVHPLPSR